MSMRSSARMNSHSDAPTRAKIGQYLEIVMGPQRLPIELIGNEAPEEIFRPTQEDSSALHPHRFTILDFRKRAGVAFDFAHDVDGTVGLLTEEDAERLARRPVRDDTGRHLRLRLLLPRIHGRLEVDLVAGCRERGDAVLVGEFRRRGDDHVAVEVTLPNDLAWETEPKELLDAVFIVRPNREILPGLALSRALFEGQHGSLDLEQQGVRTRLVARIPKANSASA